MLQDQLVFQVCMYNLGNDRSACLALSSENKSEELETLETEAQPYVSKLLMYRVILVTIIPGILSLFAGPWSDKYGRRPILMSAIFGFTITYAITAVICWAATWMVVSPWLHLFASIPMALLGSYSTLTTGIFAYMADISNEEDCAIRMSILEAALYLGQLMGSLMSGYLLQWYGSTFIFSLSSVCSAFGFIYILCYIEETRHPEAWTKKTGYELNEMFNLDLLREIGCIAFRKRLGFDRVIIWLALIVLCLSVFVDVGNGEILFLFVRERFDWAVTTFTEYNASTVLTQIIGNLIIVWGIKQVVYITDATLAIVACVSALLSSTTMALATVVWHLNFATTLSLLKGLISPTCHAIIATTSGRDHTGDSEVGKLYAVATALESLMPTLSAPIYTFVYNSTIDTYPNAYNLISVFVYSFAIMCMFMTRYLEHRRRPEYVLIIGD